MNLQRIIVRINDLLTVLAGKQLGLIHVNEYQKCGGTWIARLLRTYYGVPRKYGTSSIIRPNAIIQNHKLFTPYFYRPIIVIRDPRDVWVSFYFY